MHSSYSSVPFACHVLIHPAWQVSTRGLPSTHLSGEFSWKTSNDFHRKSLLIRCPDDPKLAHSWCGGVAGALRGSLQMSWLFTLSLQLSLFTRQRKHSFTASACNPLPPALYPEALTKGDGVECKFWRLIRAQPLASANRLCPGALAALLAMSQRANRQSCAPFFPWLVTETQA